MICIAGCFRNSVWASLLVVILTSTGAHAQDLCSGLVSDTNKHPRSARAKPALGVDTVDSAFGVHFRRITDVASALPKVGGDQVIKPLYSPVSAWNANESRLLLWRRGSGYHLYDGRTYRYLKQVFLQPADIEQAYWHPSDPDIIFYPMASRKVIRYRVSTDTRETLRDFGDICGTEYMFSESHSAMSSVLRMGLACGTQRFVYDIANNAVIGPITSARWNKPFVSPSGRYFLLETTVYDSKWKPLHTFDMKAMSHFSLGTKADGTEVWHAAAYDGGPGGSPRGTLVDFDLATGASKQIIGEARGYPYPPSGTHISGTAFLNPGWVWISVIGGCSSTAYCPNATPPNSYQGQSPPVPATGQDVLDNEIVIANTNDGSVCRVLHHYATGKLNTQLAQPYWAEPHVTASPSGTRAVFASDWGNGPTVDTYVIELPTYTGPRTPPPPPTEPTASLPTSGQALSPAPPTVTDPGVPDDARGRSATGEVGFGGGDNSGYSYAARTPAAAKGGASTQGSTSKQGGETVDPTTSRSSSSPLPSSRATTSASTSSSTGTGAPTTGQALSEGLADLKAGRYETAEQKLLRAVETAPRSAAAHYYLGYTYYLLSQRGSGASEYSRKASESITRAFLIDPTFKPTWGKVPGASR